MRDRLIHDLDSADLFLRDRTLSSAPLNEYDIDAMLDIAKICDESARALEKAIIPPCNVGDKVWLIKSLNWQRTEWGIKEGKVSMIQQKADKSWKFRVTENHSVQDYTTDKIGKTVFLTREEAEKKLKEGE